MKMLKRTFLPPQVVLLLLMLLGSSSSLFSATPEVPNNNSQKEQQDLMSTFLVGEEVTDLFDSILPINKPILFVKGSTGAGVDLKNHQISHTTTSQNYIKRSRYIFPSLGVKEVIFPFHVFL